MMWLSPKKSYGRFSEPMFLRAFCVISHKTDFSLITFGFYSKKNYENMKMDVKSIVFCSAVDFVQLIRLHCETQFLPLSAIMREKMFIWSFTATTNFFFVKIVHFLKPIAQKTFGILFYNNGGKRAKMVVGVLKSAVRPQKFFRGNILMVYVRERFVCCLTFLLSFITSKDLASPLERASLWVQLCPRNQLYPMRKKKNIAQRDAKSSIWNIFGKSE